jgi:hypothetical protein
MHTTRTWLAVATLILGMAGAVTAAAAPAETETIPSHPLLNDRFVFEFGGYYSRSSTQASLSGSGGGVGAVIDFESTLGSRSGTDPIWDFSGACPSVGGSKWITFV